jgi:SAM-dependent methyltransferase
MHAEGPNAEQIRHWNEQGGPRWVALRRLLDAQLAGLGEAAIAALAPVAGERVVDVGCGAGATTLALAARVAPGEAVGVDVSAPLLAEARARAGDLPYVRFLEADPQLAAPVDGFDAVFSRFGVMFFADPVAAFANLARGVRPGGRLAFVCWRALAENEWMTLPIAAATPHLSAPPAPPDPGAPGPFAFAEAARVREILGRAGWGDVAVTPHDARIGPGGADNLEDALTLATSVGPVATAMRDASAGVAAAVRDAVRAALAARAPDGAVALAAATWIVTARRE